MIGQTNVIVLLIAIGCSVHSVMAASTIKDECARPCLRLLMPVCGFNGEEFKVFPNECAMQTDGCRNHKNWLKTRMQDCSHSPALPLADPESEKGCRVACPRHFNPVCGTLGSTSNLYKMFDNDCVMKQERCEKGVQWQRTVFVKCLLRTGAPQPQRMEVPVNIPAVATNPGRCFKPCLKIYRPVCARKGDKTEVFSNLCEFERANCERSNGLSDWEVTACDPDELSSAYIN